MTQANIDILCSSYNLDITLSHTCNHFYYQNHITLQITKIGQIAKLKHMITIYVIIIKAYSRTYET